MSIWESIWTDETDRDSEWEPEAEDTWEPEDESGEPEEVSLEEWLAEQV